MRRLIQLAFVVLACAAIVAPTGSTASTRTNEAQRVTGLEVAIVQQLNELRTSRGLRALSVAPSLERAATAHSRAMLDGGFFAHESADGSSFSTRVEKYYSIRGFASWTLGENLAMFGGTVPTAQDVIDAWMASPGHRANLLRPNWRELGLGALFAPSAAGTFDGLPTWVITLDFGTRAKR